MSQEDEKGGSSNYLPGYREDAKAPEQSTLAMEDFWAAAVPTLVVVWVVCSVAAKVIVGEQAFLMCLLGCPLVAGLGAAAWIIGPAWWDGVKAVWRVRGRIVKALRADARNSRRRGPPL